MRRALLETPRADPALYVRIDEVVAALAALQTRLYGDRARGRLSEASAPSINGRLGSAIYQHWQTRQMPTETHRQNVEIAATDFAVLRRDLTAILETDLPALESALEAAGAPWTPGRRIP